jgi:hypothetical protein
MCHCFNKFLKQKGKVKEAWKNYSYFYVIAVAVMVARVPGISKRSAPYRIVS